MEEYMIREIKYSPSGRRIGKYNKIEANSYEEAMLKQARKDGYKNPHVIKGHQAGRKGWFGETQFHSLARMTGSSGKIKKRNA